MNQKHTTIASTPHLELVERDGWTYVKRPTGRDVVAIIPLLGEGRNPSLILIEQFRPPVGTRVIELPAGLRGDKRGEETIAEAAQRELMEETGWRAGSLTYAGCGTASAGLTDELINFFVARQLIRVGEGGGVPEENERLTVHTIPSQDLLGWLVQQQQERHVLVSANLFAGLALLLLAPPPFVPPSISPSSPSSPSRQP